MVREIAESFEFQSDNRVYKQENAKYITFGYRTDSKKDEKVVRKILKLINDSYQLCENCVHAKQ